MHAPQDENTENAVPASLRFTGDATHVPAPDSIIARLPGPVLCIGADGEITSVNEEGESLARSLAQPSACTVVETLRTLAETARCSGESESHSLSWVENGQNRFLDVSAIATEDGTTLIVGRDATLDISMRLALIDSRQRFRDLVEISSDFAWETDADGVFTFVSPADALGYAADTLIGTPARDLLYQPLAMPRHFVFEAAEIVEHTELWLRQGNGEELCVIASVRPVFDRDGKQTGTRGVCHDVTAERLRENELARMKIREQVINYIVDAVRNEARPQDMLDTAVITISRALSDTACAVYQRDGADRLVMVAHAGTLPPADLLAQAIEMAFPDLSVHEATIGGRNVLMKATHYRDDVNGAILLSRYSGTSWNNHDQSLLEAVAGQLGIAIRQIENHTELERLSRTDALTGLFNRRAFMNELERALERSRRNGETGAVFFVDLNNFKAVNDFRGHDEGDRILKLLADDLKNVTRDYDFVARLGGDEFAMWFENIDKKSARRRAANIQQRCGHFERYSGAANKKLGLSIGIAIFDPQRPEPSDSLLKRADDAMYRAKHARKQHISMARNKSQAESEA